MILLPSICHSEGCAGAVKRILGKIEGKSPQCGGGTQTTQTIFLIQNDMLSLTVSCAMAYHKILAAFSYLYTWMTGVKTIDTNVQAKTVVVEADPSVSPQLMLEKLQKVNESHRIYNSPSVGNWIVSLCHG